MPPWVQAVRLFGVGVAFYASWHHVPAGIYGGLAIVAVCWANGLFATAARRVHGVHDQGGVDIWRA